MALMGPTEAAAFLDISRQRLHQLITTDEDFPEPAAALARGPVWAKAAIEYWARKAGRLVPGDQT
ncbi:MAG: DNA-binding protein [Acidimicrobiales bacterium]